MSTSQVNRKSSMEMKNARSISRIESLIKSYHKSVYECSFSLLQDEVSNSRKTRHQDYSTPSASDFKSTVVSLDSHTHTSS